MSDSQDRDSADRTMADYSQAITYMSHLIDQLKRDSQPTPQQAVSQEETSTPGRNPVACEERTDTSTQDEADTSGDDAVASVSDEASASLAVHPSPEPGAKKHHHRIILSDLRETANLVTSTALGLNDCEVFARRAYFLVYFGLAATFFSTVLVLISPHANSFGFTASAAALSAAFVFGLGYLVSYRLLLCKATTMQKARSEEGRFPGADGDQERAEHWNADPLVS